MLELTDLRISYGEFTIIENLNLQVERGSIVFILGHHGSGKSSILNAIIGNVSSRGDFLLDKKKYINRTPRSMLKIGITLVPEEKAIFPDLTVKENLLFSTILGRKRQINDWDDFFFQELKHLFEKKAYVLSGGQAKMLSLMMGCGTNPDYLLLDEPFSGLSEKPIKTLWKKILMLKDKNLGIIITGENEFIESHEINQIIRLGRGVRK